MELSHIINQYELDRKYVLKISDFLNKSNEGDWHTYIKNLETLKKVLAEIPNSRFFLEYLRTNVNKSKPRGWHRSDPIEKTPKTHTIHAYYSRLFNKTCFNRRDKDIGRPRPEIFVKEGSILMGPMPNNIEGIDKIYTLVKPFGYDFPDILEVDGMRFQLYELCNPLYVRNQPNGQGPEPIIIDGFKTEPMSNKLYTKRYKEMISLNKQSV